MAATRSNIKATRLCAAAAGSGRLASAAKADFQRGNQSCPGYLCAVANRHEARKDVWLPRIPEPPGEQRQNSDQSEFCASLADEGIKQRGVHRVQTGDQLG